MHGRYVHVRNVAANYYKYVDINATIYAYTIGI